MVNGDKQTILLIMLTVLFVSFAFGLVQGGLNIEPEETIIP